ncbi:HD domain-containing protein [bacterium]|nr:HD domain-containing protein [bacterium]
MRGKVIWRIYQVAVITFSFYLLFKNVSLFSESFFALNFRQWEAYIFLSFLLLLSEVFYVPGREEDFLTTSYPFSLTLLLSLGFPTTIWTFWLISFLIPTIAHRDNILRSLTESSLKVVSLYPIHLLLIAMGGRGENVHLVVLKTITCGVAYFVSDRVIVGLETALKQGRVFKKNFWLSRLEESYLWYILLLLGAIICSAAFDTPFQMAIFGISGFLLILFIYIMRATSMNRINTRGVFEAFSEIAEGRWMGMVGHGRRVGMLVDEIAKDLDIPYDEREKIVLASIIHDIGIVDVPYDILNYPTEDGEKSDEFKYHVVRSAEIIEHLGHLRTVADYIRYHHERPDGSGYPEGKKGDEIPFWAYVIGACCDFDDMTCYKSYRERIPPAQAVRFMEENSGKLYDPRAVELLKKAAKRLGRY